MKCPCKDCLVYIRCKQQVIKLVQYKGSIVYIFDNLIYECVELRIFFGVNTLYHKINMRSMKSCRDRRMTHYLINQPRGKKLLEEFFNIMGYYELPTILNPTVRVTSTGIKK